MPVDVRCPMLASWEDTRFGRVVSSGSRVWKISLDVGEPDKSFLCRSLPHEIHQALGTDVQYLWMTSINGACQSNG